MPNISFASGGDSEKLDFVAYVAKDRQNVRSCYVLECSGGLSQDVITTIGQAFELRLDAKFISYTYVRFMSYSKCSNWRRISKLASNFGYLFTFCYSA
jgi:hypothetical protein